MQPALRHYKKGEYIFRHGQQLDFLTVMLEGSVHIQHDDYWGNRSIINVIDAGDMFGESFALAANNIVTNDAVAAEDCTVAFFEVKKLITSCSSACHFHSKVIQNLFVALSEKNIKLVQKLGHISQRTTREKLISYLSEQADIAKSGSFTIPFNRQQLADYLGVDRSAMSNELSKMQKDGLLQADRSHFRLLAIDPHE